MELAYILLSFVVASILLYFGLIALDSTGRFSRLDYYPALERFFLETSNSFRLFLEQLLQETATPHQSQDVSKNTLQTPDADERDSTQAHLNHDKSAEDNTVENILNLSAQLQALAAKNTAKYNQNRKGPSKEPTCFEDIVFPQKAEAAQESTESTPEPSVLPDNVIPLFEPLNDSDALPAHYAHISDAKQITLHADGEHYQLTEEETGMFKDALRESYNVPSNPRERQFREFIESFYFTDLDFTGDMAKLALSVAYLRYDAKLLLTIQTDFGTQYDDVNSDLRAKRNSSSTEDEE